MPLCPDAPAGAQRTAAALAPLSWEFLSAAAAPSRDTPKTALSGTRPLIQHHLTLQRLILLPHKGLCGPCLPHEHQTVTTLSP